MRVTITCGLGPCRDQKGRIEGEHKRLHPSMVGFAPDREQGPSGSREGGAVAATGESEAAHGAGRQGGEVYLPVLRGWVWAARVRQGRRDTQIEGDPDSPISRGRL